MKKLFVLSFIVIFMSFNAQAVEYYEDGLEHDISTPINDSIVIYNVDDNGGVHTGPPTTVNLQSGGSVSGADIYDQSILNVYAGSEAGMIRSHLESNFEISELPRVTLYCIESAIPLLVGIIPLNLKNVKFLIKR